MEWIPKLKSNRSKQIINCREIQKLATDFYRTLYSSNNAEQENIIYKNPITKYKDVPSILVRETQKTIRGMRQGDPLSSKLFNAVLEYVFKRVNWENYSININGSLLNHLRFSDDIVLLEEDPKKLEYMLKTIAIKTEMERHMLRSKINKWSKQVTLWYTKEDCRRKGRPKTRWKDDNRLTLEPYWPRVAEDRA
ncbi:Retrovirus-related Pol polyprotein from type-1 retrotransposable element R2 [Eumeta japonica]|uniref:Retrovirus-related Pol polyprotein from type-1 retrotransposable element R2 n=1 Tax=Eumeta variegata TaxID=151549 RepID=A0A4C1UZ22_EUMVA|nr:Retrovirus-related Pol polyprotein from type-1 retrotransposable element R2 [Eumeta japonica]